MEDIVMRELVVYDDGRTLLGGVDLVKLANMDCYAKFAFWQLMIMHFKNKEIYGKSIDAYSIDTKDKRIHIPNQKAQIVTTSKICVDEKVYERYVREIFDFAYTKCSVYAKDAKFLLKCGSEYAARKLMLENRDVYSCFKRNGEGAWDYQISDIKIDRKEQEEKYNELKQLIEKIDKSKELLKLIGHDVNDQDKEKVKKLTI